MEQKTLHTHYSLDWFQTWVISNLSDFEKELLERALCSNWMVWMERHVGNKFLNVSGREMLFEGGGYLLGVCGIYMIYYSMSWHVKNVIL